LSQETPLMKQFNQIKAKYPDAILLFRVGDFYETFGEDAVKASSCLGITLTKRGNGAAGEIPLAGIPYHSLDNYLSKLVKAGYRVAICEQLEDPKMTKTIVKRGVTEIITPGIASQDNILDSKKNNYLASIYIGAKKNGIALMDISTGEFYISAGDESYIDKLLHSYRPSEIIIPKQNKSIYLKRISQQFYTYGMEDWIYGEDYSKETLLKKFQTNSLKGFGIETYDEATIAASSILHYLHSNEQHKLEHIQKIIILKPKEVVWLDNFSIRNLELVQGQHAQAVSLFDILNQTQSSMGSRMLQRWILHPLVSIEKIERRFSLVQYLTDKIDFRDDLKNIIYQIGDLERLISKVSMLKAQPRDLVQIKRSLLKIQDLIALILKSDSADYKKFNDFLQPCHSLIETIERKLLDEPPALLTKGIAFKKGFHSEFDEYLSLVTDGKQYLLDIQFREQQATQISSLKIGFNNVFGYYLEVTNTHKDKVPENWIRKQTLSNAERYITPELKEYESKILGAEEKLNQIQEVLWQELMQEALEYIEPIQLNAQTIAEIDCLLSFALVALQNDYKRPTVNDSLIIEIKEGRHPVIEKQLAVGESYVPNDIYLNNSEQQLIMLTGPNMSGKSALLRQTALIVLMAQMGSFVPARSANIGYIDKLFTRVGANDNLSMGESTFMVEMNETASIVNNFSERSLILLDEIGRGTSTYDGISIAWSLAEFLYFSKEKPKTLFATHYHELNELALKHERIKNFHIKTKEVDGHIIFLRKLVEGGSEHSFGIHVAKLAGMPHDIVKRAEDIMHELEQKSLAEESIKKKMKQIAEKSTYQLSIFDQTDPRLIVLRDELEKIDVNALTPMEALMKLNEWKSRI
jgi:DNA mismatch repair protein MutS